MELNLLPSPQISVHVSAVVGEPPEQLHPDCTIHVELHPSPLIVFPSSHSSLPTFLESPQIEFQTLPSDIPK
jgi:hypothetical protein